MNSPVLGMSFKRYVDLENVVLTRQVIEQAMPYCSCVYILSSNILSLVFNSQCCNKVVLFFNPKPNTPIIMFCQFSVTLSPTSNHNIAAVLKCTSLRTLVVARPSLLKTKITRSLGGNKTTTYFAICLQFIWFCHIF